MAPEARLTLRMTPRSRRPPEALWAATEASGAMSQRVFMKAGLDPAAKAADRAGGAAPAIDQPVRSALLTAPGQPLRILRKHPLQAGSPGHHAISFEAGANPVTKRPRPARQTQGHWQQLPSMQYASSWCCFLLEYRFPRLSIEGGNASLNVSLSISCLHTPMLEWQGTTCSASSLYNKFAI